MTDWTDAMWVAGAHDWIKTQLEQIGRQVRGEIEQPHVRPWSTVMRVPTDPGLVWFKANIPRLAYEAQVLKLLAEEEPLAGPELLAVDTDRGWMLTADAGLRLRELIGEERDLSPWLDVLPVYAELQLALASRVDRLRAVGVPDRRLDVLPDQLEALLERDLGLGEVDARRLHDLVPWVRDACAELAELGIPNSIQHDDLHDGQVFLHGDRYLITDWNDSCVAHPFFSMSVTLEGVIQWGLDDVENSVDIEPFRDAYLEPFTRLQPRDRLNEAFSKALRLGWICRALTYASALDPRDVDADDGAPAIRLQMFLEGMPSGP